MIGLWSGNGTFCSGWVWPMVMMIEGGSGGERGVGGGGGVRG